MDEAGSIPCCVFPVGLFPLIRSGKGKSSIPWEWELSRTGKQGENSGEKDTDHPHLDLGTREGGKMGRSKDSWGYIQRRLFWEWQPLGQGRTLKSEDLNP